MKSNSHNRVEILSEVTQIESLIKLKLYFIEQLRIQCSLPYASIFSGETAATFSVADSPLMAAASEDVLPGFFLA
jgi:hypothetical protein